MKRLRARLTNDELSRTKFLAGELVGWRSWILHVEKKQLVSISANYFWVPGINVSDLAPSQYNHSGFYSLKSPIAVINYTRDMLLMTTRYLIIGQIDMWGSCIEGNKGFRAEYAEISSLNSIYYNKNYASNLSFISDSDYLDELRERYKVKKRGPEAPLYGNFW